MLVRKSGCRDPAQLQELKSSRPYTCSIGYSSLATALQSDTVLSYRAMDVRVASGRDS